MALDQEVLAELLKWPDTDDAIVQFFEGASEPDRRRLAGFCIQNLKDQVKVERDALRLRQKFLHNPLIGPAAYAAYATSTPSQFDLGSRTHLSGEALCKLLLDRRPDWIEDWVQRCCDTLQVVNYHDIRRLAQAGLCQSPTNDNFVRMMITYITYHEPSPLEALQQDPEVLEELVWRIFEVPYVMDGPVMMGYLNNSWADALVTLSQQGKLDRRRLLESCFLATNMGFNREQIKVFLYLHEALAPTLEERLELLESYCGLLESQLPAVAKFAFETLQQLDKQHPLDEPRLCAALQPALRSETKSQVKAALKWLANLIRRNGKCRPAACSAAAAGLLHPAVEIQSAAWNFIEQQEETGPELVEELARLVEVTSPSVKKEITKWLREQNSAPPEPARVDAAPQADADLAGVIAQTAKLDQKLGALLAIPELVAAARAGERHIPPCRFDGTELSRLSNRRELKPIESLEELVEVAAKVLEDSSLVDEAELVLEALTRIPVAGDVAALKTADPIIKRARKRSERAAPFRGCGADHDLVPVIEAWSGDQAQFPELRKRHLKRREPAPGLTGFLGRRSSAILQRFLDQQPVQLLATPTHIGGWLDPRILVERLQRVADESHLFDYDQILALLRLAPDHRATALKAARKLPGEFAAAFRYACGENPRELGETYYLWIAAARARRPFADDPLVAQKFPLPTVDAGLAAKYHVRDSGKKKVSPSERRTRIYAEDSPQPRFDHKGWKSNSRADYRLPTTLPHEQPVHSDFSQDTKPCPPEVFALAASVWPLGRESFFVPDANVEPLFDVNAPLLEMSTLGVVRALADNWAPHRTLGVDVAIAAIADGRWDAARVGRILAVESYYAHRFAKMLPDVARASHLHAYQVAQSLIHMLAHAPDGRPAGLAALLDILYELLEELQLDVGDAKAVAFLRTFSGSSKVAKCAKRLCDFQPAGPCDFAALYEQAIQGRLAADRRPAPH